MAGKIYETPAAAYPVLSFCRTAGGYFRGLVRPSSIEDPRIMLSGLVPDANVCTHPPSIAEIKMYYTKEIDAAGEAVVDETRNVSDDNYRWISYDHDTGETEEGKTAAEIRQASNTNFQEGKNQALAMLSELPSVYDPLTFRWGHSEETFPFPQNSIPAECPVTTELFEFNFFGSVRRARGDIVQNLASQRRALVFPGATAGARVKAKIRIEDARITTNGGLLAGGGSILDSVFVQHVLYLMEGNRDWVFGEGTWPDSVPNSWGGYSGTFVSYDQILLSSNALAATDPDAPTEYLSEVYEQEVTFTVPQSRIIVPFLRFESENVTRLYNSVSPVDYEVRFESKFQKATLTILQIGTVYGQI